jgi:arylsulfatase A-like enzyme
MFEKLGRAAFACLCGGIAAGAVDCALAWNRSITFLPSGRLWLLVFLCALYAGVASLCGVLASAVIVALGAVTDLGPLARAAFKPPSPPRLGRRLVAYLPALATALVAVGFVLHAVALVCLRQFHHRGLIAAVVGITLGGLGVGVAMVTFVLAAILSPLMPFGPRVRLEFRAHPALELVGWICGLVGGAIGIGFYFFALESQIRMSPASKAWNASMLAPMLLLSFVVLGHAGARYLARYLGRTRARATTPAKVVTALVLVLTILALVGLSATFSTLRQLDLRPFISLSVVLVVAVVVALRIERKTRAGSLAALASGGVLLFIAVHIGEQARVRKAALAYTGLSAPMMMGLHAISDFDGDGYASLLGGGDCNDFDRNVHPGALDWPDDGIDDDCNGHQATMQTAASRPFATLPPQVPKDLNVLLLTIDALRADHVGAYGYSRSTTPRLDALARESVRFENGWAHAPSTRYSVPAILAGRYPSTIAVGNAWWPPNVLPENRLMGEILKRDGRRTAAILSYYYFDRRWGLDQGFDDYDVSLQTLHSMGGDPAATRGSSARQLADHDIAWLKQHQSERFFLWSHYYDTHFRFERHPDLPDSNFGSDELALYDGEIRYTDHQLGRVFSALKQLGLWDKTIIVVTSDHGDGFGEHGIPPSQRHGYHLYRTETKVPLLIRVPGITPRVVKTPVGHVDILPTILNALGRASTDEPQLLGQSLIALMLGEEVPDRAVYQEVWYEGPTSRKALVTEDHHLVRNLVPDGTIELYDLKRDPAEDHDRAGEGDPAEKRLLTELAAVSDQLAISPDFARRVRGNISRTPMAVPIPLGDRVGSALTIAGIEQLSGFVRAGSELSLTLYLEGRGRVPSGYRLFTHFIGSNGRLLNADHDPLENAFPLSRLETGMWLRDKIRVSLPVDFPPGPVTVEVGLFRKRERAPASGTHSRGGAVRLATFQVAPP